MKKNLLLLIPSALALAACVQAPPRPTPGNMVHCPPGGSPNITIIATEGHFSVAPPNFCIDYDSDNDTDIDVIFTGTHAAGVITLKAKIGVSAPWLTASNPASPANKDTITVPAGTLKDTYYYTITATGWGTIDPMITVE